MKRCTFASTVERENGREVDKVQKSCGDYTASTENLKRVDFNVISVKKEASKPYPTRETPLTGDFDVELDNTGGSTEKSFTKSRTVEATSSQTYSVESGTSSSFTVGASVSAGFAALGAEFSVELSTEYSTSGFYNSGYQKTCQEKITTAFQITSTVPAGVKTVARFSKRTEPLTLKWGATIHAEGEIKLSYSFVKFGYRLRRYPQNVTISLTQVGSGRTLPETTEVKGNCSLLYERRDFEAKLMPSSHKSYIFVSLLSVYSGIFQSRLLGLATSYSAIYLYRTIGP